MYYCKEKTKESLYTNTEVIWVQKTHIKKSCYLFLGRTYYYIRIRRNIYTGQLKKLCLFILS